MASIWDVPGRLWALGRKVEDLLSLQAKTTTALMAIEDRLRTIEDRMTHLEAGQERIVTQAGAAAHTAASAAATGIADSDNAGTHNREPRILTRLLLLLTPLRPAEHRQHSQVARHD
jgi:hypothetical protein